MVVRWRIYDPVEDETLEFPVNPSEGSLPSLERHFTSELTTNGRRILFEGDSDRSEVSFSGFLLYEEDYQWFLTWYSNKYQVKLTDDLGNETWIYLTSFVPKRKRSSHYAWHIEYDAKAVVVDWP